MSTAVRLAPFNLPQIKAITDHDDMDLYTLGEQKCALYAVIPDNDTTFNFLVSLLYSQAFQALYYSADQIHHGSLPCHVHFVLDEFAAMPLLGFTRELATMRSRNISASTIIQNMAQIKELYKDSWETIPGNLDTILYLGGNEASTHKYISEALGKSTIDTKTHGQTKGRSGSYSTNFQMSGRDIICIVYYNISACTNQLIPTKEVIPIEVRINKEVRDYQESVFFGLSLRQLIFALLAVLVAVGVYFSLRNIVGTGEIGWMCVLAAFPFALGGFFTYNDMTFEKFLLAFIRSELLYPKKLVFHSENLYVKALENSSIKEALHLD